MGHANVCQELSGGALYLDGPLDDNDWARLNSTNQQTVAPTIGGALEGRGQCVRRCIVGKGYDNEVMS